MAERWVVPGTGLMGDTCSLCGGYVPGHEGRYDLKRELLICQRCDRDELPQRAAQGQKS